MEDALDFTLRAAFVIRYVTATFLSTSTREAPGNARIELRQHCHVLAIGGDGAARYMAGPCGLADPRPRPSAAKLMARRFRSHSNGAGRSSSKSLTSKTGEPSVASVETKIRVIVVAARLHPDTRWWASDARSAAMIAADPRRNAKGDGCIRP